MNKKTTPKKKTEILVANARVKISNNRGKVFILEPGSRIKNPDKMMKSYATTNKHIVIVEE